MTKENADPRGDELPSVAHGDLPRPTTGPPEQLTRDEWLRRFRQRFIVVAQVSEQFADGCMRAESFEVLSDGFEDDPEGAADMEMSYWND